MRLFIAIRFDGETTGRLLAVQERLRRAAAGGSFSHRENLHLTLAFLGEVEPDRLPCARRAMDRTDVPALRLRFESAGCFDRDGGGLWWAGLRPDPALMRLQRDLCDRLREEGFLLESRRFIPHITLARQVALRGPLDRALLLGPPFETNADGVSLMQSHRPGGRLTYTELYARGRA